MFVLGEIDTPLSISVEQEPQNVDQDTGGIDKVDVIESMSNTSEDIEEEDFQVLSGLNRFFQMSEYFIS